MKEMVRRALVIGCLAVSCAGCASTPQGTKLGYASLNHLWFSVRTNWQEFVGWSPIGTTADEATAAREGGWWGPEVPVLPAP
jgi:hypothetical protein